MLTILFDGIAYGMLLFVLACGLSVKAATDYVMGSSQQSVRIPEALTGQFNVFGSIGMGKYRLLIMQVRETCRI